MPVVADADKEAQDIARRSAEKMFAADRASQALGIEITDVAPGRASAKMSVRADMVNGHDICHGGLIFALADTAFAFACNSYGVVTLAASAQIDFLRAAKLGDVLQADAEEVHRGRRSGHYDVRVSNQGGRPIALFRGRSAVPRGSAGRR